MTDDEHNKFSEELDNRYIKFTDYQTTLVFSIIAGSWVILDKANHLQKPYFFYLAIAFSVLALIVNFIRLHIGIRHYEVILNAERRKRDSYPDVDMQRTFWGMATSPLATASRTTTYIAGLLFILASLLTFMPNFFCL